MDDAATMTSQPVMPSSHVALDAIKTLKGLALFCEHEPGFIGLCKALSAAETVLQHKFHVSLSMPTLKNWFKPNNMSNQGFEGVSEMVDLTKDDIETASIVTDM